MQSPEIARNGIQKMTRSCQNKDCDDCKIEICSEECFNSHPGSMIALKKIINQDDVYISGMKISS